MKKPNDDCQQEEVARLNCRLEHLSKEITRLEDRLSRIENSLFFRLMRGVGLSALYRKRQFGHWLLHSRLHPFYLALRRAKSSLSVYTSWIECRESAFPSQEWHQREAESWLRNPVISVLMPTRNPRRAWLEAAVDSVAAQSYECWQLCVCDDASNETWVREYLEARATSDSRIRVIRSDIPLGISGALNLAGTIASGEYVAFLDHDDLLHHYALHYVAEAFQDPNIKVVYSDEDHLDELGRRVRPFFKPDWSPDLLLNCMYFGHLFAAARVVVDRVGWFRSCCDGSQDYDLALRITSESIRVRHIPLVLYHWREHAGSTAASVAAKPYTQSAGRKALEDALATAHTVAAVTEGPVPNTYYITRKIRQNQLVSIIICSRNPKLLGRCLRSLDRHTTYSNREIVVVRHETVPLATWDDVLGEFGARSVSYFNQFNFSRMCNLGVEASRGGILLFLNDDVQAIKSDWLEYMVAHAERPEIGVVGAKLIYPSGSIQHAGVVTAVGDGVGHIGRGIFASDEWPWLDLTRNVSAVTGACMGICRSLFTELGGFDVTFPVNYNDIDLCLRVRRSGYLIVYEPRCVLRHDECRTRVGGTRHIERERFHERWGDVLKTPDPYYSPSLNTVTEQIRLCDL
jgi:GT2 family glycosyltransferase